MSKFSKFMKANKIEKKNEMYAATKSLCDENGKPLNGSSGISLQRKTRIYGMPARLMYRSPENRICSGRK